LNFYQLFMVAEIYCAVNHQRRGFQRVNFTLIYSPLGIKDIIAADEEVFARNYSKSFFGECRGLIHQRKWGQSPGKWGQSPFFKKDFLCRCLIHQTHIFDCRNKQVCLINQAPTNS